MDDPRISHMESTGERPGQTGSKTVYVTVTFSQVVPADADKEDWTEELGEVLPCLDYGVEVGVPWEEM